MAGFEGGLREVQGVRAPRNFGRVRVSGADPLGLAADLFSTVVKGGAELLAEQGDAERETAFATGFTKVTEKALDRLDRLAKAGEQGGDRGSKAFLNEELRVFVKQFNVEFPGNEREIIEELRIRGHILPGLQLLKDVAEEEARLDLTRFTRTQTILTEMNNLGFARLTPDGEIDEPATLQLHREIQEAATTSARIAEELGFNKSKSGAGVQIGLGTTYTKNLQALQRTVVVTLLAGMSPVVNRLSKIIATGGNESLKQFQELQQEIAIKAREFKISQLEITINMNPVEKKHHMDFVNETILAITQGVLEADKITDINQLKGLEAVMKFAVTNNQIFVASELRFLSMMAALSPELMNAFVSIAKFDNLPMFDKLKRGVDDELSILGDMIPPRVEKGDPPPPPRPITSGEEEFNESERTVRVVTSGQMVEAFTSGGINIKTSEDASMFAAIMGPLFNAYYSREGVKLSANDKTTLSQQMQHPRFTTNLAQLEKFFPDAAPQVGAFGFDVVQGELLNLVRGLRNFPFFGSKGENFEIEFNPSTKQFELVTLAKTLRSSPDPSTGEARADITLVPPISQAITSLPTLQNDVKRINSITKFLLNTRQYKDVFKGMSEADFIKDLERFITGDLTELTGGAGDVDLKGETLPEEKGVSHDLINALGVIESSDDPTAVSSKGAVGRYQIIPATGLDPGFGVKPVDVHTASEEDQRIFVRDYLLAMKKKFGSLELALAAYNAGPGTVEKVNGDISKLPKETRDYLDKFRKTGLLGPKEK